MPPLFPGGHRFVNNRLHHWHRSAQSENVCPGMWTICFGNLIYGLNHEHRFTENGGLCCNESITTLVRCLNQVIIALGIRPPAVALLLLAVFPAQNPKSKIPKPVEHCQGGGSGRRGHDLDRRGRAVQWTERFAPRQRRFLFPREAASPLNRGDSHADGQVKSQRPCCRSHLH
jgi:hypothetical protein